MNKKERAELIDREADEMARSGKYPDWLSIEHALRGQGYHEARQVLDSFVVKSSMKRVVKPASPEPPPSEGDS
jgi:hypothetical protein